MADGSPHSAPHPDLRLSFASLYRQHAGMVRRALRQLGVAPVSLDDAVQDVFVVLHRRIDDFDYERSLKNWLWGIARGVASGYRRSERRRDRLHAVLPAPEGPPRLERGVAQRQAAAILDAFLGSLDADKCAVFVLSEIEGRRGPEIAALLDVNLNTVYARLRAARKRFDAAMQRHRAPADRPVLGAWLPWTWLGKPAAAAGASAVVVAATLSVGPSVTVSSAERVPSSVESPSAREVAHRWPRAAAPQVAPQVSPGPASITESSGTGQGPGRAMAPATSIAESGPGDRPMSTVSILLTATVAAALAAPKSSPSSTDQDADAAAQVSSHGEVSVYEFADDTLTGEHLSPDGSLIPWRRPPHHVSLIDLRGHFIPELVALGLDV